MRLLNPEHALLTTPNKIGASDFDGWVQERGLYYANPCDSALRRRCCPPTIPARRRATAACSSRSTGSGVFIYTGLAFFRQLPAGVPGAWRLFANLVSPAAAR